MIGMIIYLSIIAFIGIGLIVYVKVTERIDYAYHRGFCDGVQSFITIRKTVNDEHTIWLANLSAVPQPLPESEHVQGQSESS